MTNTKELIENNHDAIRDSLATGTSMRVVCKKFGLNINKARSVIKNSYPKLNVLYCQKSPAWVLDTNREELLAMLTRGGSCPEIASKFGCDASTVERFIKANKELFAEYRKHNRRRRSKAINASESKIVSSDALSEEFGQIANVVAPTSNENAPKKTRKRRVITRSRTCRDPKKTQSYIAHHDEILRYLNLGMTKPEVAEKLGISLESICHLIYGWAMRGISDVFVAGLDSGVRNDLTRHGVLDKETFTKEDVFFILDRVRSSQRRSINTLCGICAKKLGVKVENDTNETIEI